MTTLDTLSLRFEAETAPLFSDLDSLETRLQALANPHEMPLSLTQELDTRLTVTADEAIQSALSGAGERLAQAVESHEAAFDRALAAAEHSMATALEAAVSRIQSAIHITVPVNLDGYRVGQAVLNGLRRQSLAQGNTALY